MLAVRGSFARRNKLHIKRKQGSTLLKRFCNLPSFRWPRCRGRPDLSSVIVLPIRCSLTCCVIFTAKCPAAADAPVLPMARGEPLHCRDTPCIPCLSKKRRVRLLMHFSQRKEKKRKRKKKKNQEEIKKTRKREKRGGEERKAPPEN